MFVDPNGLVAVMVQYAIEKNGGSFEYDAQYNTAFVSYNGTSNYFIYSEYESINGHLIIDSEDLARMFGLTDKNILKSEYIIGDRFIHMTDDKFRNADDAALGFGLTWNAESINANKEYGAAIYKNKDGSFSFGMVFVGVLGFTDNMNLKSVIHSVISLLMCILMEEETIQDTKIFQIRI